MRTKSIEIYTGSLSENEQTSSVTPASKIVGAWEIDPADGASIQFRIPKEKFGGNTDRIAFYVSASGKIGIGTKEPEDAFDVRDMAEDVAETQEERAEFDSATAAKRKKLLILGRQEANQKISGSLEGNAKTATKIATARNIGGVSFDGSADINLPGVNTSGNQDTTGNAATATKLATARNIGGVSFDGSRDINLPGVNAEGNQDTSGNAATATILANARRIGGVAFNGSADINLPGVNAEGNQNTSGNAETAGKVTVTADESSANHPLTFIDDTTPDGAAEALKASRVVTVNPGASSMTIGGLTISYTQGDGRTTFGTITFAGRDAGGSERSVTLRME